jgi:hypothetical protein
MTIITLDEDIKLKKNHFKNINELLLVNLIYKRKKLSLKQLIKKYDLKESHS